jgi:ubiquinone/menaquinone biosynthesis C-methylase UbiE
VDRELEKIKDAYSRRNAVRDQQRYSLWEEGALFRYQERQRATLKLLARNGFSRLEGVKILDVGCGHGGTLRDFVSYGARPENLAGIDLLEERIECARRLSPHFDLKVANAAELPFPDGSFDLAVTFTLFSSIKDPELRKAVADEIVRVLRRGGALLWYDFWTNPLNPDVEPLGLDEVRRLFGRNPAAARRETLAPPVARLLASRSWIACELLAKVPLLRTHWLALVRVD